MKGVVFNLIEEIVSEQFGHDTWDHLLDATGLEGAYTSLGNYDDSQLQALVAAAAKTLGMAVEDILRFVGEKAFPGLADRYPNYPGALTGSRVLFHQLNDVIHPEVLAMYPGAATPQFESEDRSATELVLRYSSERGLCHLAEGLALGATLAFGEHATVAQEECRLDGGSECRIVVTYRRTDD